ncbi:MDR family MFS transporter [Streptomyces olivaceoviridis]
MTTVATGRLGRALRHSFHGLPSAYWWLWTSNLINRLGSFVAAFLALYVTTDLGHSAAFAGFVGALYGLGGTVASVVAGVLTDRVGRRPTIVVSQASTSVAVVCLALVRDTATVAVCACLCGFFVNAARPATQAMMIDIVPQRDRVRAYTLNYWATNIGLGISSTAAGAVARHNYAYLFYAQAAAMVLCTALVLAKLPESRPGEGGADGGTEPPEPLPPRAADPPGRAGVSLWTVFADRPFMALAALNLLLATIFQLAYVGLPLALQRQGHDSSVYGLVIGLNSLLVVVLQLPLTRLTGKWIPGPALVGASLLAGYGFGLYSVTDSLVPLLLATCVWTLGEIISSPAQVDLVIRLSPTHGRGRYQGVNNLSFALASLSAPLVSGWTLEHFAPAALWTVTAACGTCVGVGYHLLQRRISGMPAEEARPAPGGARRGRARWPWRAPR